MRIKQFISNKKIKKMFFFEKRSKNVCLVGQKKEQHQEKTQKICMLKETKVISFTQPNFFEIFNKVVQDASLLRLSILRLLHWFCVRAYQNVQAHLNNLAFPFQQANR
jgi:hypothetical protein